MSMVAYNRTSFEGFPFILIMELSSREPYCQMEIQAIAVKRHLCPRKVCDKLWYTNTIQTYEFKHILVCHEKST